MAGVQYTELANLRRPGSHIHVKLKQVAVLVASDTARLVHLESPRSPQIVATSQSTLIFEASALGLLPARRDTTHRLSCATLSHPINILPGRHFRGRSSRCPQTPPTARSWARSTAATPCAQCSTNGRCSSACWMSRPL